LNSHCNFGLIFEDDAEVITDFNFEIPITGLYSNTSAMAALGWIPRFASAKNSLELIDDDFTELVTPPTCTFSYAINRSAAELMNNTQNKVIDLAEWHIHVLNRITFYSTNSPWATANHSPKFSTIGE
jgi:hypothetical protein